MLRQVVAVVVGCVLWVLAWVAWQAVLFHNGYVFSEVDSTPLPARTSLMLLAGAMVDGFLVGAVSAWISQRGPGIAARIVVAFIGALCIAIALQNWQFMPVHHHVMFVLLPALGAFGGALLFERPARWGRPFVLR